LVIRVAYSLIATAKLNAVDPQAWLADVLVRIAHHPIRRLDGRCPGTGVGQQPVPPPWRPSGQRHARGAPALTDTDADRVNCRGAMSG